MFHQSGGCCDGSSPMCYPQGSSSSVTATYCSVNYPGAPVWISRAAVPDLETHPGDPRRRCRTGWRVQPGSPRGRAVSSGAGLHARGERAVGRRTVGHWGEPPKLAGRHAEAGPRLRARCSVSSTRDTPAGMAAHKRTPRLRRGSDRRSRAKLSVHDHPSRSAGRAGHRHSERDRDTAILVSGRRWVTTVGAFILPSGRAGCRYCCCCRWSAVTDTVSPITEPHLTPIARHRRAAGRRAEHRTAPGADLRYRPASQPGCAPPGAPPNRPLCPNPPTPTPTPEPTPDA